MPQMNNGSVEHTLLTVQMSLETELKIQRIKFEVLTDRVNALEKELSTKVEQLDTAVRSGRPNWGMFWLIMGPTIVLGAATLIMQLYIVNAVSGLLK